MKRTLSLACVIASISFFGSSKADGPGKTALPPCASHCSEIRYKLTVLNFWGQAINDKGIICGSMTVSKRDPHTHKVYYEDGHLAMWKQGRVCDLGRLADTDVCAAPAINSRSEIVGSMSQKGLGHGDGPPDSSHIFRWSRGHLRDFGVEGHATAINDKGQFVGQKDWAHGKYGYQHGFLYTNGRMQEVVGFSSQEGGGLNAINNKGQMLGVSSLPNAETSQAFLRYKHQITSIHLPGPYGVDAQQSPPAINDAGQVVINTEQHAPDQSNPYLVSRCYVWQAGRATELRVLPGFTDASGVAINNRAEVVGNAEVTGAGYRSHPFLWKNGLLFDLNDLTAHPGWTMTKASGINNRSQIIGQGQGNGKEYNFLLTPIK